MPGLTFLETLGTAIRSGDTEAALAFYHPDARMYAADTGLAATGWRQIAELIERQPSAADGRDLVLIGYGLSAVVGSSGDGCAESECPRAWMDVFGIYDGAIGFQLHSSDSAVPTDDPLYALYNGSAEAYSAHDLDALQTFYSDAVFAPPFPTEEYEVLFATFPDLTADPLSLSDLGLGDGDRPALFDFGTVGAPSDRSRTAAGVYQVTFAPGVSAVSASVWRLWDGQIVEAATMFETNGWDRMLESANLDLPMAWFMSIETPAPRHIERTHVIEVGDGTTVELFDGNDQVAELIEWSLERFRIAGIDPPHVDAVYLETERSCLEESAWTHLSTDSAIIRLCLDADDLGNGDRGGLAGEFTMLHELAHVWTAEYLSQDEKEAFSAERGLAAWNAGSSTWSDRGNEHASEIMAWGLAERPVELVRLGSPDCRSLTGAFFSLTGVQPLRDC